MRSSLILAICRRSASVRRSKFMREMAPVEISSSPRWKFFCALSNWACWLLFQAAAPITAAIFSWLLLRERLEKEAAVAAAAAIVGVVIMVSSGLDSGIGWAILIVTVIPVGLGIYSTLIRAGSEGDPLVPVLIAGVVCFRAARVWA